MKIQRISETKVVTTNMLPCDSCKELFECQEEFNWESYGFWGFWVKSIKLKTCPKCQRVFDIAKEENFKEWIKTRDEFLKKYKEKK